MYSEEYKEILKRIDEKREFKYDPASDKLYQQYKDTAKKSGETAMKDAIGKASALTGGYGNSYAQTAGQQAYNNYMQQADSVIPQLYQLAYNAHNSEMNALYTQLDAAKDYEIPEYDPITLDVIAGAVTAYGNDGNVDALNDFYAANNYDADALDKLIVGGEGWHKKSDGGAYIGKIDDNATIGVRDMVFSMGEFYDALRAAGMSKTEAKKYIDDLQFRTGISKKEKYK